MNRFAVAAIVFLFLVGGLSLYIWYAGLVENSQVKISVEAPTEELFPFGTPEAPGVATDLKSSAESGEGAKEVENKNVSGFILYEDKDLGAVIRYVERETGHVYDLPLGGGGRRITNTTIPKLQEVVWLDKTHLVLRYLNDKEGVVSFSGEVKSSTSTEGKLAGSFLPENIFSVSKTGNKIIYLLEEGGQGKIYTANLDGSKRSSIFSSELREWVLLPASGKTFLMTKPSGSVFGHLFELSGRDLRPIVGDSLGLLAKPNENGSRILLSRSSGGSVSLSLLETESKVETLLPFKTLPEKCAFRTTVLGKIKKESVLCAVPIFMPSANYPDAWYRGEVSFEDLIYEATLEGVVKTIRSPEAEVDAINLSVSADGSKLVFKDKISGKLFVMPLEREN